MTDRFESMALHEAMKECSRKHDPVFDNCGKCKKRVGLHCSNCNIQTTGCLCTEVDRFGEDEAWQRAVEREGEEMARERYRQAGLYVPETPEAKKLILPGDN